MNRYPCSVFIMDLRNSSLEGKGKELSAYLSKMTSWLTEWTGNQAIVKHRRGDEVLFISEGYAAAFVAAHFLSISWKQEEHPPYFGLSFGEVDSRPADLDAETWIHPLLKQAREANDLLKREGADKAQFAFRLNGDLYETQLLLNSLMEVRHTLVKDQTDLQKQVYALVEIYRQQRKAASMLSKSPSTISSHFKKGKGEELVMIFNTITAVLDSLQQKGFDEPSSNKLIASIRSSLQNSSAEWFSKREGDGSV
ncbi:hypothetical protein ACTSEZ_06210 [Metabacillus sp. JX24]|uniref:hypothetical protein n=1 Tax=Metabacillus sp. JX24 TaxID=3240759 RepID=UPI0035107D2C